MSEKENLIASQPELGNLIFEKIEDSGSDEVNFFYFRSLSKTLTITWREHKV
jgi:hypothetical protein